MNQMNQTIEIVKKCIEGDHCKDCVKRFNRGKEAFTTCKSVMTDSVEILERWKKLFTPKRPNEIKRVCEGSRLFSGYCDSCGRMVFIVYEHCPNCGQALLWTERGQQ